MIFVFHFPREENSIGERVERASQTEIMKVMWSEEGILIGDLLGVECQTLKRITKKKRLTRDVRPQAG